MHVAAEHGHVDVIRTLAESWVLCWIHETPERVYAHTATVEDNGAVAEALNALGLEHPGDVIIEPSSYTPDGTPVFIVPPSSRPNTRAQVSEQGERFADRRSFIRVRSTTTGVFNELMKAFFYWATSHKSRAWLLEADVETQEDLGWRPFHTAAERGQPKSVRALAKLGADGTPQTATARCRCIGQR